MKETTMFVKMRYLLLAVLFVFGLVGATRVTSAHAGGVTCDTDPAYEVANATVTDRGYAWSSASQPNPLWEVSMPDINTSIDVYADSDPDARTAAAAALVAEINTLGCVQTGTTTDATTTDADTTTTDDVPAPPATTTTTDTDVSEPGCLVEATQIADASTVTYVGDSWGPIPLYEVVVPSLNMTVDVAVTSSDQAASAAIPVIEERLTDCTSGTGDDANAPSVLDDPTTTTTNPDGTQSVTVQAPQETSFAVDGDANPTGLSASAEQGVFATH